MNTPNWVVKAAKLNDDYTIYLEFADGSQRTFDARALLDEPFYEPLKKLPFFLTGRVDGGAIVWGDEIDIAPEVLYERSQLRQAVPA